MAARDGYEVNPNQHWHIGADRNVEEPYWAKPESAAGRQINVFQQGVKAWPLEIVTQMKIVTRTRHGSC
jgi:hypothetical protein